MNLFLGWSVRQWAAAKSYHLQATGKDVEPSFEEASLVRRYWHTNRYDIPSECDIIIGAETPRDTDWAIRMMYQVYLEYTGEWYDQDNSA